MKRFSLLFWALCISLPLCSQERGSFVIPDLKGYMTLKCDFHTHTTFSDGKVSPTVRIEEAYREGLDVIAITDHINSRSRDREEFISHNRPYEIAKPVAESMGIILIQGSELSPMMPPGHHNAIFLTNSDALDRRDYMEAFRAAKAQNAFIFWNHPGDPSRQPDTTLWWPEHTRLLEQGMMHGIEIANNTTFFPEAFQWCLEKKLTVIGNTDAHGARGSGSSRRTMTLLFARSATPESLREALDERRTAVYYHDFIIGEEKYLKELFENALEWKIERSGKIVDGGEEVRITVRNNSDLTFRLKKSAHDRRVVYFRNISIEPYTIAPRKEQTFTVRLLEGVQSGEVNFIVENFLVQPDAGMNYTLTVR